MKKTEKNDGFLFKASQVQVKNFQAFSTFKMHLTFCFVPYCCTCRMLLDFGLLGIQLSAFLHAWLDIPLKN